MFALLFYTLIVLTDFIDLKDFIQLIQYQPFKRCARHELGRKSMTLREFLGQSTFTVNLDNYESAITQKIRHHVQNIDVLADKDIIVIKEKDIVDIFVAILLYKTRGAAVLRSSAWEEFVHEANQMNIPEETTYTIAQNL